MVEDMARNLQTRQGARHDDGVDRQWHRNAAITIIDPDFVDHVVADAGEWLESIIGRRGMSDGLDAIIDRAGTARESISAAIPQAKSATAVDRGARLLDSGEARVAEPAGDGWHVNQWLKKAVLL